MPFDKYGYQITKIWVDWYERPRLETDIIDLLHEWEPLRGPSFGFNWAKFCFGWYAVLRFRRPLKRF